MGRARCFGMIQVCMKGTSSRNLFMGMGAISGLMDERIQEAGRRIRWMVMERILFRAGRSTKDNIRMTIKKGMARLSGQTEEYTQDGG